MFKYIAYSGYANYSWKEKYADKLPQDFFNIWYKNTRERIDKEIKIFGPDVPDISQTQNLKIITQHRDLGPVGDYMANKRTGRWCGWTAGIIYGMIDAYTQELDFLYKEQDCLAFGDYVTQMYTDLGDADIVYGTNQAFGAAQSLFLVKRNAIPHIIAALGQEDDGKVYPEHKFIKLPCNQKRLSFGYDRDRPFNVDDSVFYIQQPSVQDMEILVNNKLL